MKKFLFPALLLVTFSCVAQKKIKYETVFFEEKTTETPVARYLVTGGVSENEVIKAKVKITNYTDKTIVIKPEECFFTTPKGNVFSHDRWIVIAPREQESKVIDAKGDEIKTDSTSLNMNGVYTCNELEITKAPGINLPPEKEIKLGNFRLELDGYDKDGKEIMVKFRVEYTGTKIGSCAPGKITIKSGDGKEFKSMKEKDRVVSFKKNDDFIVGCLFIVDDKKAEYTLNWNDAFTESTPEKAGNVSISLKIDQARTEEKNK